MAGDDMRHYTGLVGSEMMFCPSWSSSFELIYPKSFESSSFLSLTPALSFGKASYCGKMKDAVKWVSNKSGVLPARVVCVHTALGEVFLVFMESEKLFALAVFMCNALN